MKPNIDYTLYLVTDRELMVSDTIEECVEQAVLGGCSVVQLREKTASSREFYQTAVKLRELTSRLKVPLIINDRVDIALAVDADGVHIGQTDLPYNEVRCLIGTDKIVGVSVSNVDEAQSAASQGADYLGVGAMFPTGTKTDSDLTSMVELWRIREIINIPIVVIGGINKDTIPLFRGAGIEGIAVVSAVVAQKNPAGAARELKLLFQSV
jgi:thiamine-phosphate pyrophosphorylase